MKILMAIWLTTSIFQMNLVTSYRICDYNMNHLFAKTFFFDDNVFFRYKATCILIFSSTCISGITLFVSIFLNISLSLDLISTFWYPFAERNSRGTLYLTLSIMFGLLMALLIVYPVSPLTLDIGVYLTAMLIITYLIIATYTIIYVTVKMFSPGVSKEAVGLIWKRHVSSTIVFIMTNIYTWLNILYMFNPSYQKAFGNEDIDYDWVLVLKILFMI